MVGAMKVIHYFALALIVCGLLGMLVCEYQKGRIARAILVMKWCELDSMELNKSGQLASSAACDAYRRYAAQGDVDEGKLFPKISPLLDFYSKHPDYLSERRAVQD